MSCHIINKGDNVAPKWFREFVEKRFDPAISEINERLAENDARLNRIDAHLVKIDARLDNIVKKNKLVE
ncbi:MAG: hypothetical protein LBG49_01020 [Mycoplasmataceae bacterium]|nr:hypothetical protein [Mycoplasmataceae bacterium]